MFDKAKDKVEEMVGKGQEEFGRATQDRDLQAEGVVRKNLSQASYAVNDAVDTVKRLTSDNPVPALLIAAGVGFLLAKLVARRYLESDNDPTGSGHKIEKPGASRVLYCVQESTSSGFRGKYSVGAEHGFDAAHGLTNTILIFDQGETHMGIAIVTETYPR